LQQGIDSVLFPAVESTGIKTPWPRLTEMTGGWAPGDLIIVAGRPSMGKSVIALQQAYTSSSAGIGVAYISLEMSKESLIRRLVASISRVDAHRARSGFLSPEERRRMLAAATELQAVPLFLDESRAHTPVAVSAALRKLRTKTPIGLVMVDHLQLMKVTGRPESRHSELSEICHGFKRLACQMGCVVMLLSQLNRSCEQDQRLPVLSDLKESGSIEEDADAVIFTHRPEMYRQDDPSLRGKAELIVAKQRNGPTGKLAMTFLSAFQRFEETSTAVEEETR
jgi:replicative DNA helicase